MKRTGILLLITILVSPSIVLACSGYGAPELIEVNRSLIRFHAVITAACFLASVVLFFLRGRKGLWVVLIATFYLVLNPAWFYGGGGGDCGMSKVDGAKFWNVLLVIGVAYQLRGWIIAGVDNRPYRTIERS